MLLYKCLICSPCFSRYAWQGLGPRVGWWTERDADGNYVPGDYGANNYVQDAHFGVVALGTKIYTAPGRSDFMMELDTATMLTSRRALALAVTF